MCKDAPFCHSEPPQVAKNRLFTGNQEDPWPAAQVDKVVNIKLTKTIIMSNYL